MIRLIASYLLGAVALYCLWSGVLSCGWVSPASLAYPGETLRSIPRVLAPSGNLLDVWATVWRSSIAFLVAVPLGVTAGVLTFLLGRYSGPSNFVLEFLRSTPATALVPVFLILFGVGDVGKISVGIFSAGLVIALATRVGLEKRNPTRIGVTRLMKLSVFERIFFVDLPEAAPQIVLGLRTGISLALILVVVSEMLIGSSKGLGRVIEDMRYSDDKGRLYASIIIVGCIGFLYNKLLQLVDQKLVWWRHGNHGNN